MGLIGIVIVLLIVAGLLSLVNRSGLFEGYILKVVNFLVVLGVVLWLLGLFVPSLNVNHGFR